MILGLPPILGLLPIVIYAFLGFKNVHPLLATAAGVLAAAVLAGKSMLEIGAAISTGAGSFLGIIGLLVMFGTCLAEMLKDTGAAPLIVKKLMFRFAVSPTGILVGTMISIALLTVAIGSMIAAAAMVATVAITLAATYKVSPAAMGIAFHTGSVTGLILGPFTPPTVQILKMTEMSYGQHLLSIALPFSLLIFITGVVMSQWAQKKYGKENGIHYPAEEAIDTGLEDGSFTKEARWGAKGFIFSVIPLIAYGISIRGGMSYALAMILACTVITGMAARYSFTKIMEVMIKGVSRMAWFYVMFVLFDPFINFVSQTGAFTAMGTIFSPLINAGGSVVFLMIGALVGIFGISGAAVAQVEIMHGMFGATALAMGVSVPLYYTMLLVGSQITSFAYPGADMMTELGLARSNHIKSLIINGWVVTGVMIIYMLVRGILNI